MGNETIRWIQHDLIEIWGWFDVELMGAWKNLFPLAELNRQVGFLPLNDEVWIITPNLWWRFLTDRPPVPILPPTNLRPSATKSKAPSSEKSLSEAEAEWI